MSFQHSTTQTLPTLNAEGRHYYHQATGCELFHLHCADKENLFSFAFRTPPSDDTGVTHILEHTVLCGSRNFPVKDPFARMVKSSMNTFLNAMTFTDRTLYPASSAVPADFFHLMEVYADAVFFPLLKPELFYQEAFHWEFLPHPRIQGVVYNEMKGSYSSRDSIAARQNYRSLFPQGPYSHDFGGDPASIPTLSHEQLLQFHAKYYHPSNALIFLYGDIPTEKSMDFLEEKYLRHFSHTTVPDLTESIPRMNHPRKIQVPFPATGDISRQTNISVNWLLHPCTNMEDTLLAHVMDDVLLGNSASPLYAALIQSGLGQGIASSSGTANDCFELSFSAGLEGTEPNQDGKIEELIEHTLKKIVRDGFSHRSTESVLRRIETRLREQFSGSSNGLQQLYRTSRAWAYQTDMLEALQVTERFMRFREHYKQNPQILVQWIDQWLLQNTHRSTVTVYPDPEMESRMQTETEAWMQEQLKKPGEKERLVEVFDRFSRMQNTPDREEDVAKLPRLNRSDIPKEVYRIPHTNLTLGKDIPGVLQTLPTNGLIYLQLAFDLGDLDHAHLVNLPLLREAFTECGIKGLSHDELAVEIDYHTAGIEADISGENIHSSENVRPLFILHTKFLDSRAEEALALLFRILTSLDFSLALPRLEETIREQHSGIASSLVANGHSHAMHRAARSLSLGAEYGYLWYSFPQLDHLSQSAKKLMDTAQMLGKLSREVISQSRCSVALSCETDTVDAVLPLLQKHLQSLPRRGRRYEAGIYHEPDKNLPQKEALILASSVAYNAIAFPGFRIGTREFAAQVSLSQLLNSDYLWEHVRMRNGAYGAFAIPNAWNAVMLLASYRDPHIRSTLEIFHASLEHFSATPCQKEDVTATLFSILGKELRSVSPEKKTNLQFHRFLRGITDEFRQTHHDHLLALTPDDIQQTASRLCDTAADARVASLSGELLFNNPDEVIEGMVQHRYDLSF